MQLMGKKYRDQRVKMKSCHVFYVLDIKFNKPVIFRYLHSSLDHHTSV